MERKVLAEVGVGVRRRKGDRRTGEGILSNFLSFLQSAPEESENLKFADAAVVLTRERRRKVTCAESVKKRGESRSRSAWGARNESFAPVLLSQKCREGKEEKENVEKKFFLEKSGGGGEEKLPLGLGPLVQL